MTRIVLTRLSILFAAALLATQLPAAEDVEHEDQAMMIANAKKHLAKAKLTLEDAITLALKKYPDGHAVEAGFEVEDDDYDYVVEIASGGRHHEVEIDALTGKVEGDEEEPAAESNKEDNENTAAKSKITLIVAMNAALEAVGGAETRCFQIEPHLKAAKLVYDIHLLSGKQAHEVWVDGVTGKVTSQKKID